MEDYKIEIVNSRVGFLGSSDAKIIKQVAMLGEVPRSAYKRLAVCKGLIEHQDIPYTDAVRVGDEIEMAVFNSLKATDERWLPNVRWESQKYKRKNVGLISHPDFLLVDKEKKILFVYENKASKFSIEKVRKTYDEQLYIHYLLAKEEAKKLGKSWKVRVFLSHYSTEGLDLSQPVEFDPNRLTVQPVRFFNSEYDVGKAMDIIDNFLEGFNEFYDGDDIDAAYLPANVKQQFETIAGVLTEIKEREAMVEDFKEKLYQFMNEKEIKSIKSDLFSITRVDSTMSKSFDHKKYIADLKKKHPRIAKKIVEEYTKTTVRNGYVTIKVKDNDKE